MIDDELSRDWPCETRIEVSPITLGEERILCVLEVTLEAVLQAWPRSEVLNSDAPLKLMKWAEYWVEVSDHHLDELELDQGEARELERWLEYGWITRTSNADLHPDAELFYEKFSAIVREGAANAGLRFRR